MFALDFGIRKQNILIEEDSVKKVSDDEVLDYEPTDVYLETGCPYWFLHKLMEKGFQVYQIDNKEVKQRRREEGFEKSDENDAKVIFKLAKEEPSKFNRLEQEDRKNLALRYEMGKYRRIVKVLTMLKNQKQAFEREFGRNDLFNETIDQFEERKKTIISKVYHKFPELNDLHEEIKKKLGGLKGLGKRLFLGVLANGDPRNFHSKVAYINYCGLTEHANKTNEYNRRIKTVYYQIQSQTMKQKDEKYYPMYKRIKAKLEKNRDWTEGHIDKGARIRVMTQLAKDFYDAFNSRG